MNLSEVFPLLFFFLAFGVVMIAMGQVFHLKHTKNRIAFIMYACMAYLLVYIKMVFDLSMVSHGHFFLTGNLAGVAAAGFCYFYACSVCDNAFELTWSHVFIILGCIAAYAIPLIPFWLLPASEKGELIRKMVTSGQLYWHEPQIWGVSVLKISNFIFGMNAMVFTGLTVRRLWRTFDREGMWRSFHFYMAVLIFMAFIATIFGMRGVFTGSVLIVLIVGVVSGTAMFGLYLIGQAFPWILYDRHILADSARQDDEAAKLPVKESDKQKISERLSLLMGSEAVYKRNDLTVSTLAAQVGVAPYLLSAYLNQIGKKRFTTYINDLRIAEACRLFASDSKTNNQIVARETGFNSDTHFYFVFQTTMGVSPGKYRRQLLKKKPQNF